MCTMSECVDAAVGGIPVGRVNINLIYPPRFHSSVHTTRPGGSVSHYICSRKHDIYVVAYVFFCFHIAELRVRLARNRAVCRPSWLSHRLKHMRLKGDPLREHQSLGTSVILKNCTARSSSLSEVYT